MKIQIQTPLGTFTSTDVAETHRSEAHNALMEGLAGVASVHFNNDVGHRVYFGRDLMKRSVATLIPTPGQQANNSKD